MGKSCREHVLHNKTQRTDVALLARVRDYPFSTGAFSAEYSLEQDAQFSSLEVAVPVPELFRVGWTTPFVTTLCVFLLR